MHAGFSAKNPYRDVTVVIPTYNEAGSISELVRGIRSSYSGASVLVVDDGSTDSTKKLVGSISKRDSHVTLIDRKAMGRKRGLTASVIDGMAASKTPVVVVMDGDLQHPYKLIGSMVSNVRKAELAIGVRSEIRNWPMHRRVISKGMVWLGLAVLSARGRRTSRDIMSGFFCVRRDLFMKVYKSNKDAFVGEGFKVLFDFLKTADPSINVIELPYVFKDREHGVSNAKLQHGIYLIKSFLN